MSIVIVEGIEGYIYIHSFAEEKRKAQSHMMTCQPSSHRWGTGRAESGTQSSESSLVFFPRLLPVSGFLAEWLEVKLLLIYNG